VTPKEECGNPLLTPLQINTSNQIEVVLQVFVFEQANNSKLKWDQMFLTPEGQFNPKLVDAIF
jgi:hypothetical protein